MIKKMLLSLFVCLLLIMNVNAIEMQEIVEYQKESLELDKLERAAKPYLGSLDLDDVKFEEGLETILNTGLSELNKIWKSSLRGGILILSIVFFEGAAGTISYSDKTNALSTLALAVVFAITTISATDVKSLIGLGEETMSRMTEFSNILFPSVTALAAATGAITGGAIRQMAAILFSDILMNLMTHFLVPVIYSYIVASAAYAATGNEGLKRIAALLKWVVTTILTAVVISFVTYLTISGVIAGQTDKAAIKATKFAFSSAIPVVGKLLSDAAESVLAGVGLLKGTVGLYGMLAILGICIIPFLRLGVHYLVYKLTAVLASTVGESRTVTLIDNISGAFGFIIGMTGAEMLMLLLSIVSALSVASL